ncbi:hypothetical protein T492DRAFT_943525 [Pavlovales sp. CCMP2436]|nr:hypothetical protein T492DRAFT_943525 [Pavlovales sp. CCMP2436]
MAFFVRHVSLLAALLLALAHVAPAAGFAGVRSPVLARSSFKGASRIFASSEKAEEPVMPVTPPPVAPPAVPPIMPVAPVAPVSPVVAEGGLSSGLDIRLLPYVLVPLFVLAAQLFLTFSRDTLPVDMLGAADMTK